MDLPTMPQATSRAPCHSNPHVNRQRVETFWISTVSLSVSDAALQFPMTRLTLVEMGIDGGLRLCHALALGESPQGPRRVLSLLVEGVNLRGSAKVALRGVIELA